MTRCLRQPANFLEQLFPSNFSRFRHGLSLCQFCDRGAAGHGWNASFGKKTDVGDTISIQFQTEFEDIAAGRIFDSRDGIRLFHFAGIARVLKMVEQLGGVHRPIVVRPVP